MIKAGDCPEVEIAGVADLRKERRDWFSSIYPDVPVFEDGHELIDSSLVEAVMIEVPHYFHPEFAIYALRHGLHVLSDKPAGVYTKQVREMNEEAAKHPELVFAIMFNQRTNPLYIKMKDFVSSGELGEIKRVNWIITDWYRTQIYYDSGAWRATWNGEGGGVLLNQCPHQMDLVTWICGMPERVRAFCHVGKWHDIEVEDEVTVFLTYKNGATGTFITTTGEAPGENRFEIIGTGGKLVCESGKLTLYRNAADTQDFSKKATSGFAMPECTVEEVETDGENPQHSGIINNFTNAILGKEKLFVDGKEGIAGVELMNAIEYSGWHDGEKVELPINEDLYLRELNAHRAVSRIKIGNDNQVESTAMTFGSGAK